MLRRLIIGLTALVISTGAFAQSGTLKGKVLDGETGEPIPFANVSIEENGNIVTGGMTDFDGQYQIKPIPAGKYTVKASYVGYAALQYNNVQIQAGNITFQDFELKASAEVLEEVEIKEYKVPLIKKDQTQSGGTVTADDIAKMPGRSADAIATTVGGVYSEDGEVGSIRGARSEATVYYVDGVKVRGTNAVPKSAIEQISVVTGGIAAKYGDATGGIISVTTKGPTSKYFGGAEVVTSQFLDPYGYNLGGLMISGPIYRTKEAGTDRQRTVAGFLISSELEYIKDGNPSAIGTWVSEDDIRDEIADAPLRVIPTEAGLPIIYQNAEFLREDAFKNIDTRPNAERMKLNLAGKLDFQPIKNLNLTFGGTMDYRNQRIYSYANSLFNSENNGQQIYNNWRVYGRLTQKFQTPPPEEGEEPEQRLIKNAYYSIQVDYSKTSSTTQDMDHKDNFFDYGYIGKYETIPEKFYQWGTDTASNLEGWIHETYFYRIDSFSPGTKNPELSTYSEQFFDIVGDQYYIDRNTIIQNGGLLNGSGPGNIAGLYTSPGVPYTSYSKSDANQMRVAANGVADINDHELTLGFEFEQRKDNYFGLAPFGLWGLAEDLMNKHIMERDLSNPNPVYDANGVFQDTINYSRLFNASQQALFDMKFREYLGKPVDGLEWIDVDSYDPDEFDISYFSASELLNQGNAYVSYYGYDHTGEKLDYDPSFEDFFTKTDEYGNLTRPIAAFQPNYIAGYIQDKFSFKDLIFNVGVRVDRYDANQRVLRDSYIFSDAYRVGESDPAGLLTESEIPGNINDGAVVYVNDAENPSRITGFRDGDNWYNDKGTETENPNEIAGATGITPYLLENDELNTNAFVDYEPQITVMPRVAFSFPISDEALFFAHYDILSKRPSYNARLNPIQYLYIRQINQNPISNPNQTTEKTIDYEVGYQQKLGNTSSLKLSAYYREMRDMQQAIAVNGAYPVDYYTYGNIDFGTVKGFTVAYDLRRTGNVSMRASYTLQFANGTGSSFESGLDIIKSDQPNLRTTIPLNFDQRHNFAVTLDYRFGGKVSGTPYKGPKWFNTNFLANTGVNFVVNAGSGSPYSQLNRPRDGKLVGSLNGSRKPWRTTINMRLDRDVRLTLKDKDSESGAKAKYAYLNVYLEISNLLNSKNVLNVYGYTGNPNDDGFLTYSAFQDAIATQTDEEAYRNYYAMYINSPYNYSTPRTIRLGVQFSF
ncbi:MAG: carboxypeptidase-like regulatory domain-containing protein [Candidatus Delongbacteria bacterium]|nr:carboxypeptidase-like regulatory domain-containing protein [Candidatus Delongbacteria bacterium]